MAQCISAPATQLSLTGALNNTTVNLRRAPTLDSLSAELVAIEIHESLGTQESLDKLSSFKNGSCSLKGQREATKVCQEMTLDCRHPVAPDDLEKNVEIEDKTSSPRDDEPELSKECEEDQGVISPGNGPIPLEIAISFDTTGSMSSCIEAVKAQVRDVIMRLFGDIPQLRIAIIAHGDYCDEQEYYLTQQVDFTQDVETLCRFVKDVEGTGGGDIEECYELILNMVGRQFTWTPGTRRALIMIGDSVPHEAASSANVSGLDWRKECDQLSNEMGIRIYGVQCRSSATVDNTSAFWDELADRTGGRHVRLDQFATIVDTLMAICYKECGGSNFEAFEAEIRNREGNGIRQELNNLFGALRYDQSKAAVPCTSSPRFSTKPLCASKHPCTPKSTPKLPGSKVNCAPRRLTITRRKKISTVDDGLFDCPAKRLRSRHRQIRNNTLGDSKPNIDRKSNSHSNKVFRESIPDTKFMFGRDRWSSWKLAYSPEASKNFIACEGGFRNTKALPGGQPALYEVSVQPAKSHSKRYPVYLFYGESCYARLRRAQSKRLSQVLQQGCKVYVRRLSYPCRHSPRRKHPLQEKKALLLEKYDYAWNTVLTGKQRTLIRHNCTLSDDRL